MSSRPLLLGGLVIAACLAGLTFGWLRPSEVLSVAATFLDSVRDFGAAGMLVFVAAQIVIAFTGLMPASLLGMVAGAAYGLATGFILVAVGTVLGSMLGFLVARSTLSGFVEPMLNRFPTLRSPWAFVERDGWRSVCLLRISPVMPFAVTSYALGLSMVSLRDYIIGTFASLPSLLGYVLLGTLTDASLSSASSLRLLQWALLAAGIFATLLFLVRIGHSFRPRDSRRDV